MIGPVRIEAKIYFMVDDEVGSAVFNFPVGEAITEQVMLNAIGSVLTVARKQFRGRMVRLMDAETFFNDVLIVGKYGQRCNFALPGSFAFDAGAVEAAALKAVEQGAKT